MPILIPGSRVGPYTITSAIGAGGMGEVYRARDERLARDVAVKILPQGFAEDADRVARFHREARLLAALNHPNIATIHGIEQDAGITALVMELVDGEDLSERLARGPLAPPEVLRVAEEVANALEAAHRQGIIHRDLKPANIKVRADGAVKVLDFGLAKFVDGSTADPEQTPTVTSADLTHAGVVVGTTAYMSPEQTRGQAVDTRTDIWAFGCVLYEMLTGRRAFEGKHHSDVVAAILTREPDLAGLPVATPPAIRRLLKRCLRKDLRDRLRDIGDARLEIREADGAEEGVSRARSGRPLERFRQWLPWSIAGIALIAWAVTAARPDRGSGELRVHLATPPTPAPYAVAIAPDGRRIVYVASSDEHARLWLRALDSDAAEPLPGTEGANAPFWSPDGRSIGFFAGGKIQRVDVDTGSVRALSNAATATEGSWGRDGVLLFSARGNPLARVDAEGGEAVAVNVPMQGANFAPYFLSDGRRFLYHHRGDSETRGIYVANLNGQGPTRRLVDADSGAVYAPSGHLLFVLNGTLFAQPFDETSATLSGTPAAIADHVPGTLSQSSVSVSNTGVVAYRGSASPSERRLVWFDRAGRAQGNLGDPSDTFSIPSLSPAGDFVLFYRGVNGNVDIWTMDTARGALRRVTEHPADDVAPVWSPDSRRIIFSTAQSGTLELRSKVLPNGVEETLTSTPGFKIATDWSRDGKFLLFTAEGTRRSLDIWALPLEGDRQPRPVVHSPASAEEAAQFSPDGRWIAYQSNESGRPEIYVQPFAGPGDKVAVSTGGGSQVRWRANGGELFYVALNGDLMAVPIALASNRPRVGKATRLFALPIGSAIQLGDARHQYMVSADGQRFLVATVTALPPTPISLILNWRPAIASGNPGRD